MKAQYKLYLVGVIFLLLQACAVSNHVTEMPDSEKTNKPAADKAMVIFMRPSSLGGAIQAVVYDGDNYVSTVSYNTQVAYETNPGKHMFMVVSEAADFMEADLKAGKTYYALVTPRFGVWRARFSLKPINNPDSEPDFNSWYTDTKRVRPNEEGLKWSRENKASVMEKQAEYLPKWQAKAESEKPKLYHGR